MWTCPICKEGNDGFDPEGHRHYLFHFLPPNDNGDTDFYGPCVRKAKLYQFVNVLTQLLNFKGGFRSMALSSIERITLKLPSFPVQLRDFVRLCVEHQCESMGDEDPGCEYGTIMSDVDDYIDTVLTRCARDLRITSFYNPSDPDNDWDERAKVYWTTDTEAAILDFSQRLNGDLVHLRRLRLKGSKYVVDH